jgi:hypothetical protein
MAWREQDQVHVLIPQGVEVTLNVLGVDITATSDSDGRFRAVHRKEVVIGDLDNLRRSIERVETEASQKRERVTRLKEAATNPEPALLYRSGSVQAQNRRRRPVRGEGADVAATLEPIHVRGVDQRSGLALVIRENGNKESMTWDLITRPLAGVEKKKLLDLAEKEQRTTKEIPTPVTVKDVLPRIKKTEVAAAWDREREAWVVKFGKEELVTPPGYHAASKLESRILARLIIKQTPYRFTSTVTARSMVPAPLLDHVADDDYGTLSTYTDLFKTEAEVFAMDKAVKAAERAEKKREEYLATLLIDRSMFTS